jgi:phosphopantetheine adenylyltransferase
MNQLTKFLVDSILNEGDESLSTVALFGGGFKPPTKGHLDVVLQGLRDNPEVKQVYILVGSGVRNGITQEESVKIWKIYKRFIPVSTQIVAVQSPFSYIKTYLQDHQDENVYIFIGARPDNDEDEKDVAERSAYAKKYSEKAFPVKVTTPGNISGTKARAAAKQSKEAFYQFLPDQLSTQDKEEIYNIILPTLNEVGEGSSKPYEWREDFDEYVFTTDNNIGYIVSLSEMSEGDKMGIAVEFLAKTPEMDGYSSKIEVGKGELFRVMATIIDIIKSHLSKNPEIEFILYSPSKKTGEGDIGNQRDKLYKIFLQKQIPGIRIRDIGTSAVIAYLPKRDELNLEINKPGDGNAAPYGSGYNKVDEKKDPKKGTGKKSKGSDNLNENASYSKDIDVKGKILELTKHMLAKGMNIKPLPKVKFVNGDSNNAREFLGKTAYYNPENQTITLYTEGRHPKDIVKSFSHEMIHHIQNLEDRLGDISTTNTMKDDRLDKLEQEANLKGTMTFRNWTDSLNEGKQVSTIYHYTTFEAGLKILQSNQFRSGEAADSTNAKPVFAVSFTRDKRFHDSHVVGFDESSFGNKPQLRFTIDGNKLSNRFSVQPHSQGGAFSKNRKGFEAEERVVSNKPFTIPLSDYLMSVDVLLEYKKTSNEYDILSTVDYEMYAPLRAKIIKFAQDKNLPINLIVNKNGDPWPDKVKNTLIQKILDWFTMKEANLKGTMTFRNWTDSLNEDLSNISLDYIKTKLPKLDSYPKSDIILSKGDFVYLEIPQDANNPYSMVYEIKVFDIKDGTLVAQSSFDYDNNNKLKGTLDVRPDKRRMGIATEIYKLAEKVIGDTIFPEEKHTEDAEKFWRQKNRSFGPQNYDSLNEVKYTNPNFELEWEEAVRYPEFKEMGKENWIKVAKQGKLVNYSSIKDVLGNVDLNFDNLEEPKKQRFQSAFKNGTVETPIAVKFSENDYDLVAGNTRLSGLVKNGEDPKIWIVNIGSINEYDNSGPTTPKTYIVKDDGTYKEVPIKLLSKIPNLTYDMGGGETNYYPEKNIVIIDNIPIEEFVKDPGEIKDEKIYVEYNLNQSYSFPKANKILVAQLVYHLDDIKSFAKTVANSLKDGGVIEFFSDVMSKEDKMFLEYLSSEFGFEIPLTLSKYKNSTIEITKNKYTPPTEYYIYEITDDIGDISKISTTKKGSWWKYVKVKGNLNFKSIEGLNPEHFNQLGLEPNEALKKQLEQFSEILGYNIIKIKKLNESNKPYKHKHGFDDKLGKDPFGLNQFAREIAEEVISEGRYDTLANKLSSIAFKAFKDIHDRGDKEGSFKFRVDTPDDEHDIPSEDFYFDFEGKVEITDDEYGVDGGANSGFDNGGNEITPLLSVKFKIPKNPSNTYPTWQDISFDIKDVIRHELEHLTQDGDNEKPGKYIEDDQLLRDLIDAKLLPKAQYFKLEKEIDAMLQGLYFKAKKLKRPYKKVIDDYLATQSITQEEKNDILKIWRSRVKALSLPLFESEGISELFTIYLDIDGVIADFDKRFTELAGMGPREYEDSFGSEKFWDFIDIKHKIKFFSKMDWMPEGKKLYNFIKQFDHKLLSAPSKNDASKVGKRIWAKENTPETQLILSPAYNKKNYADKSNILIDDREKNIQQWKDAGGIGILFKSTDQVIDELKKIMNL